MAAAAKFLFDVDFAPGAKPAEKPVSRTEHALKLAEAESRGFKAGYAEGEKAAVAEAERRRAAAFEQIGDAIGRLARGLDAVQSQLEAEAVEVAAAVGHKLAPALIAQQPFAEIEALARAAFRQLNGAPHVVVRVNDALLETARDRLQELAHLSGFEGRLVVLAEPQIALGDGHVEWADGGMTRDRNAIGAAIDDAIGRYLGGGRGLTDRNPGDAK